MITKVGKCDVEVRGAAFPALWHFTSGAHGKKEAGVFAFWTAVLKKPQKLGKKKVRRIFGRALVTLPPGDRFDRMKREMLTMKKKEVRAAYRGHYVGLLKCGKNIKCIRPSTEKEMRKWMKGHKADAKFARRVRVKR